MDLSLTFLSHFVRHVFEINLTIGPLLKVRLMIWRSLQYGKYDDVNFNALPSLSPGVNAITKEITAANAMVKHSHLPDRQMESPPKRPKSAEGKTSTSEQVWLCKKKKKKTKMLN